jgi:hypothetical protein
MANLSSTHTPTHGGLERVIERAEATQNVFASIFSAKQIPTYVLGLTIMAVVTLTERAMDAVNTGFALEWAALTVVALATFGLLSKAIVSGTQSAQTWLATYAQRSKSARADAKLWDTAQRDPRVMHEIVAAQGRALAESEVPAPVATVSAKHRADDGLAPLAPWAQLSRYY